MINMYYLYEIREDELPLFTELPSVLILRISEALGHKKRAGVQEPRSSSYALISARL